MEIEHSRQIITTGVGVLLFCVFFFGIVGTVLFGLYYSWSDFQSGLVPFHNALEGRAAHGVRVIAGKAQPSADLITSPNSSKAVIAYRINIEQEYEEVEADGKRRRQTKTVASVNKEIPFVIDADGVKYEVSGKFVTYHGGMKGVHVNAMPGWVSEYSPAALVWKDWNKGYWVYEKDLEPGGDIMVMGVVEGAGPVRKLLPPSGGYEVFIGSASDFGRYYDQHANEMTGLRLGSFAAFGVAGLSLIGALIMMARKFFS